MSHTMPRAPGQSRARMPPFERLKPLTISLAASSRILLLDFFRRRFATLICIANHGWAGRGFVRSFAIVRPGLRACRPRAGAEWGFDMLPGLRFIFGAALGGLTLILMVFGLAATVRITQQTKIGPIEPSS